MIAVARTMFAQMAILMALLLPAFSLAQPADPAPTPKVSAEQAKAAALQKMSGRVTSVDLEKKQGKYVWVVEIRTRAGAEKDVFVDIETGQVLSVED